MTVKKSNKPYRGSKGYIFKPNISRQKRNELAHKFLRRNLKFLDNNTRKEVYRLIENKNFIANNGQKIKIGDDEFVYCPICKKKRYKLKNLSKHIKSDHDPNF